MNKVLQYYQIFCDLSLDVVFGVLCNCLAIDYCFNLNLPVAWFIGLPAATWLVYLSDHALDISKHNALNMSPRLQFIHVNYKSIIALIVLLFFLCTVLLLTYYSNRLFFSALVCFPFIAAYFLLTFFAPYRFQWLFNKELLVAFIYGIALYAVVALTANSFSDYIFLFFGLLIACYINLLMISIIEIREDLHENKFSWVLVLGRKHAQMLLYILIAFSIVFMAGYVYIESDTKKIALMLSYLLIVVAHALMYSLTKKSGVEFSVRKWSEASFWLPVLTLLAP